MKAALFGSVGLAILALSAAPARADTFDLGPGNLVGFLQDGIGKGQGVVASKDFTVDRFGFYADLRNAGNAKFMIWDGANAALLYSQTVAQAASLTPDWIYASNVNFGLAAGQTYYFGFIADSYIDLGFIAPTAPYSAAGLTALQSGNSTYLSYASPMFQDYAGAQIGLRIDEAAATAAPEASTWAMMLAGFAGLTAAGWLARKSSPAAS